MLVITSFIGSMIGFLAYYYLIRNAGRITHPLTMRLSMINCMALAFIFAMLIELTTGSKLLSIIIPIAAICAPAIWMIRPSTIIDVAELLVVSLMSVAMSVMLIGMVDPLVIWFIQIALVLTETLLLLALSRRTQLW